MTTAPERPNGPSSSPPPCPAENSHCENASKDLTNSFNRTRCQFTYADGRRCANERAYLCARHGSKHRDRGSDSGALAAPDAALVGLCADLTTATNINRALTQTYLLLAQGRISQKQAVAFGYLSQLLLQTVPGIRAEHVSAFGYPSWESRLKESLVSQNPIRDGDPPQGCGGGDDARHNETEPEKATDVLRPPSAQANPENTKSKIRPFEERVMSPDFGDLYQRSVAMLDRKYDLTPEGRKEAKTLALELELLNPAPAKPRGDKFGRVAELVRRLRDHQQRKTQPAIDPRYVESIRSAPHPPSSAARAAGAALSGGAPSWSENPQDAAPSPPSSVAPSSPERSRLAEPQRASSAAIPQAPPASTGHTVDWYAPASWSRLSPCGQHLSPCGPVCGLRGSPPDSRNAATSFGIPGMRDRSQHLSPCGQHLSSMSNFRSRHLQHQHQSRSFWR